MRAALVARPPVGNVRRNPASATSPGTLVRPLRPVLSPHREQGDTSRGEEGGADQGRGFLLATRNRTVHGTNVGGSQDRCAGLSCLERRSLDTGKLRECVQPGSETRHVKDACTWRLVVARRLGPWACERSSDLN